MQIWFSSDSHFGHENLWCNFTTPCPDCQFIGQGRWNAGDEYCPYCQGTGKIPARPFTSTNEMDELMIEKWNAVVKPSDHAYHLGDVAMKKPYLQLVRRLNGHKRLILGNHDIFKVEDYMAVGFEKICAVRVLDNILFTHIPVHPFSLGRFAANGHGHTHSAQPYPRVEGKGPYINLCVEQTGYAPVSLEWVKAKVKEIG